MQSGGEGLLSERLREVISVHFDPRWGSRYWLEHERRVGINARQDISKIEDLILLGPMDSAALADRPVEDFVPASLLQRRTEFIFAETGGTLGKPRFVVYRLDEFRAAFVEPFVAAAERAGFPRGANWLFLGPSGPHIIGRAARACANAMGSPEPFMVDFDARWAKKLLGGGFASQRYLKHIEEQALRIIYTQHVGVIFGTPAVLAGLGGQIDVTKRQQVLGIHLGGMPIPSGLYERLAELFPRAVMLSGYGNTLCGMAPQLRYEPDTGVSYYPHGCRMVLRVIEANDGDGGQRIGSQVEYGQRGQIVVCRLDETQLIVNMIERDTAVRLPPPNDAAKGFILDGLGDPQPIVSETVRPAMGLY